MDGNEHTMDDFAGFLETDISDVDFFAAEEEETETEDVKDKSKKNPASEDTSKEEEEQEEEESTEDDFFEDAEQEEEESEEEESEEEESEEEETETQSGDSITTLNLLKGKGFLDYELEEGEELTDEKASEILEDSLDNLFEERIAELFEDVPEIVKEMNKFVLKGGDINAFLQTVAVQNTSGLEEGMDLELEANQELVIRHGLKEEGYDKEYIDAQIEFLKDSKRMKKHSETHYKKWETKNKAEQTAILKSQEKAIANDKAQRRALKNKVTTFLKETDEVTGFTVTKQDRKDLPNYMSDRVVKLDNGNQITGMQKDLMRVLNSPTGSVQMAKLLKAANEQGELNFEEIKKETETKVTKKVRENVRRNKKSIVSQSGGGKNSKPKRPLADYFN